MIGRARMAIVLVVSLQRAQGSALPGRDPHETESLVMPNALMGHAGLIARAAAETLQLLPGGVLGPDVTAHPVLTAVPGRHAIASLAKSAMAPLATMTPWLTPMRYPQSLTVLPGAS